MARETEVLLGRWLCPHHFILLLVLSASIAFITGYAISVGLSDVPALFPYISDTGTKAPASCVFGLFLNLSAVFAVITMFIQHGYFEKYNCIESTRIHVLNDVAMFLGSLSAFGIMLVANFQWTNVISIHLIGAFMTFILGILYCWIHSYLSFVTVEVGLSTKTKFYIRVALSVIASIFLVSTVVGAAIATKDSKMSKTKNQSVEILDWEPSDPGYSAHLVSTFSEWIMVFSFLFYFLTFYGDFKYVVSSVSIRSLINNDELQQLGNSTESTVPNQLENC